MTPAQVFSLVNMTAMVMWVLMIFLPKWKMTRQLIRLKLIPIVLSLLYVVYIIQGLLVGGAMDFGSLASVMQLFTEENAVLAGWIHYLAFDLLIGMWLLKQNEKIGMNHLLLVPCLFFTFMFGPAGFLLFTTIKTIKIKQNEKSN